LFGLEQLALVEAVAGAEGVAGPGSVRTADGVLLGVVKADRCPSVGIGPGHGDEPRSGDLLGYQAQAPVEPWNLHEPVLGRADMAGVIGNVVAPVLADSKAEVTDGSGRRGDGQGIA